MKQYTLLPLLFTSFIVFSQVGIGTDTSDIYAILDVVSTEEVAEIITPVEGLLVYNTKK